MCSTVSSPRAAKMLSFSTLYRELLDSHRWSKCSCRNVGSTPIITRFAPASFALSSAAPSDARRSSSRPRVSLPARARGGTLISRFCWPSSRVNEGSSIFSSTSAFAIAGLMASSTRASSISRPICWRGKEKLSSASIVASASRHLWIFSRYLWRSSRVYARLETSLPMPPPLRSYDSGGGAERQP
jgi:hypothetical protein